MEPRYSPQAQTAAVCASTTLALLYVWGSTVLFMPNGPKPGKFFALTAALFLVIALIAGTGILGTYFGHLLDLPRISKLRPKKIRLEYVALYASTILAIILLGWVCIYSGGPVKSPYSVILLAVALLSPFVSDRWQTSVIVATMAVMSYVGFWQYSTRAYHPTVELPSIPENLVALTAIVSVFISIVLEKVRQLADAPRRTGPLSREESPVVGLPPGISPTALSTVERLMQWDGSMIAIGETSGYGRLLVFHSELMGLDVKGLGIADEKLASKCQELLQATASLIEAVDVATMARGGYLYPRAGADPSQVSQAARRVRASLAALGPAVRHG